MRRHPPTSVRPDGLRWSGRLAPRKFVGGVAPGSLSPLLDQLGQLVVVDVQLVDGVLGQEPLRQLLGLVFGALVSLLFALMLVMLIWT